MRKLLLASAAVAIMGTPALAADNDSITVQAYLAEACNVSITNALVSLPVDGSDSTSQGFTYDCNFGGETADATLTFSSFYGGVSSDLGVTEHEYNIVTSTGPDGTSALAFNNTVPVLAPNTGYPGSFTVDLVTPINVAGTYTDTLTITIAP